MVFGLAVTISQVFHHQVPSIVASERTKLAKLIKELKRNLINFVRANRANETRHAAVTKQLSQVFSFFVLSVFFLSATVYHQRNQRQWTASVCVRVLINKFKICLTCYASIREGKKGDKIVN